MANLQRVMMHIMGLYILGNGAWMTLRWMQDDNAYKDNFIVVVGIASLILGLAALVFSFVNFDKKKP